MTGGFGGGISRLLSPDFVRRDIPFISRELTLAEEQGSILEVLLGTYEEAFQAAADAARAQFTEIRPQRTEEDEERSAQRQELGERMREVGRKLRTFRASADNPEDADEAELAEAIAEMDELHVQMAELRGNPFEGSDFEEMMENMNRLRRDWYSTKQGLANRFLNDLQAVLSEGQLQHWDAFQRSLRREKKMPEGELSGERSNLFVELSRAGATDSEFDAVDELLMAYSMDLDTALQTRERVLDEAMDGMMMAMQSQDWDMAIDMSVKESSSRVSVRDINLRYLEQVASELPEHGEQVINIVREQHFPSIYRATGIQRALEAAAELDGITEEIRSAIGELIVNYGIELTPANALLYRLTLSEEPARGQRRIRDLEERQSSGGSQWGAWRRQREEREPGEDPLRDAFDDRNELDDRYRGELQALLTEEQLEGLPGLRRGRGGQWNAGGRGGDDGGDREARRQQFMERFDTDGDGDISDEERDAIREYFRENGGSRGGRGGSGGQGGRGGNNDV